MLDLRPEIGRIEPAFGSKSSEVCKRLANAFHKWSPWHGTEVALQGMVVQIIGNWNLPFPKSDESCRGRLRRAQGLMEALQIDDLSAQVIGLCPLVGSH